MSPPWKFDKASTLALGRSLQCLKEVRELSLDLLIDKGFQEVEKEILAAAESLNCGSRDPTSSLS